MNQTLDVSKEGLQKDSLTRPIITLARSDPVNSALQLQQSIGNQALQQLLRSRVIQAKLAISNPDDPEEREADTVADTIMRKSAGFPTFARCSCAEGKGLCEECQQKQSQPVIYRRAVAPAAQSHVPRIVGDVLRSSGLPLDSATRAFFEPRFGRDFSRVRIHTGSEAAESARSINALAYTLSNDLVFGHGQYAPDTNAGRTLLAHELTHVLQQSGGGTIRTKVGDTGNVASAISPSRQADDTVLVQRACASSTCPPVELPVPAVFPLSAFAERCIQEEYAATHPAKRKISLSFNDDWRNMTGGSRKERLALDCLNKRETPKSGPNFTALSGMYGGEPDIWDFRNQTIYEITTRLGAAFRRKKLVFEVNLANHICGLAECGGLSQFAPGTWQPPRGCFDLARPFFLKVIGNDQGVIIYGIVADARDALAVTLASVAAAAAAAAGVGFQPPTGPAPAPVPVRGVGAYPYFQNYLDSLPAFEAPPGRDFIVALDGGIFSQVVAEAERQYLEQQKRAMRVDPRGVPIFQVEPVLIGAAIPAGIIEVVVLAVMLAPLIVPLAEAAASLAEPVAAAVGRTVAGAGGRWVFATVNRAAAATILARLVAGGATEAQAAEAVKPLIGKRITAVADVTGLWDLPKPGQEMTVDGQSFRAIIHLTTRY
jgi:hypothetical protein